MSLAERAGRGRIAVRALAAILVIGRCRRRERIAICRDVGRLGRSGYRYVDVRLRDNSLERRRQEKQQRECRAQAAE